MEVEPYLAFRAVLLSTVVAPVWLITCSIATWTVARGVRELFGELAYTYSLRLGTPLTLDRPGFGGENWYFWMPWRVYGVTNGMIVAGLRIVVFEVSMAYSVLVHVGSNMDRGKDESSGLLQLGCRTGKSQARQGLK